MDRLKSFVVSLRPVKALRAGKWRGRALSSLLPRAAVAWGSDPARRRELIEDRKKSDPAVEEWERQALRSGCPADTAEDMLWYRLAYGFSFEEYRCYGFPGKPEPERLAFFSDKESVLLSYRLNDLDAMGLFTDKWRTYRRFGQYYRRDAVLLGSADDYGAFLRFLKAHPDAIAKPARGSCGRGVRRIGVSSDAPLRESFAELLSGGGVMLEEPIAQSGALARFHPASVNTVRAVTFRGARGVRLLWAFLRTGRGGSLTDNGAGGGIMAGIDPEEGRVDTSGIDEKGERFPVHPDTGERFAGFLLPEWEELKKLCLTAAAAVPEVRMIGWDASHTRDGWVLVEGNAQSELIGPQAVSGRGLRQDIMEMLRELRLPTDEYRVSWDG